MTSQSYRAELIGKVTRARVLHHSLEGTFQDARQAYYGRGWGLLEWRGEKEARLAMEKAKVAKDRAWAELEGARAALAAVEAQLEEKGA